MQQPVGEYMPPFPVRCQLNLINDQTVNITFQWHRLNCTAEISGMRGDNFFFACYQCDSRRAQTRDDFIIIFSGKKPERKADHPALMPQHPVNGIKGFTGIRRSQNTFDGFTRHDGTTLQIQKIQSRRMNPHLPTPQDPLTIADSPRRGKRGR